MRRELQTAAKVVCGAWQGWRAMESNGERWRTRPRREEGCARATGMGSVGTKRVVGTVGRGCISHIQICGNRYVRRNTNLPHHDWPKGLHSAKPPFSSLIGSSDGGPTWPSAMGVIGPPFASYLFRALFSLFIFVRFFVRFSFIVVRLFFACLPACLSARLRSALSFPLRAERGRDKSGRGRLKCLKCTPRVAPAGEQLAGRCCVVRYVVL